MNCIHLLTLLQARNRNGGLKTRTEQSPSICRPRVQAWRRKIWSAYLS